MSTRTKHLILLTAFFALSRVVIYHLRPFYYAPIHFYMQYLDTEVLRHDLLQGLCHLHSQPPLFNLFLGIVLKLSPAGMESHAFAILYFVFSLVTVLCLYAVMRRLGVRAGIALSGAALYALLPSVIQAERWLFYACPVSFLVTVSAYALVRFAERKQIVWYGVFAGFCAAIVLTRSFFHFVFWLLPILVASLHLVPRNRRMLGACSMLALGAVVLGSYPYVTNAAKHGMFTASTWQGMSLAKMTRYVPEESVDKMIEAGSVTPLARIPCFSDPAVYRAYYGEVPETGVTVLDRTTKSNGEPNWNDIVMVRASREYQRNSPAIIRRHPVAYLKAVLNELYLFFGLRSHVYFDDLRNWRIQSGNTSRHLYREVLVLFAAPVLYGILFVGGLAGFGLRLREACQAHGVGSGMPVGPDSDRDQTREVPVGAGTHMAVGSIEREVGPDSDRDSAREVPVGVGTHVAVGSIEREVGPDSDRDQVRDAPPTVLCLYALFLMLYVFGLASLLELGEGCYMRMPIEPLIVAGCFLLITRDPGRKKNGVLE